MIGHIHSVESMGLVDGPGVRAVVFLQGCSLRCLYCHNPDTWSGGGTEITPEDLTSKLLRFRPYFSQGGGVTFSGGEPLLQPEFLAEMLRRLHGAGIHTCLDTAGCGEAFVEAVRRTSVPMWVRHVVVPGLTDGPDHLASLEAYITALPNVEKVELLPYHTLGVHKYASLGLPYPLEGVPPMDSAELEMWNRRLNESCRRKTGE